MIEQNMLISRTTALWLGLCGIVGSLVLFAGDMLFYYNGDSADFLLNMGVASSERIIISGVCALIAAWLYTLASGQIYYAFQPTKKWQRLIVFFSFIAIMITYGVVHGAYVAIATSAKIAVATGASIEDSTALAIEANNMLRFIAYVPFGIFTLFFIPLVWLNKTHYPKWLIAFSPAVPFLLSGFVVQGLQGEWKVIIGGGYLNLILTLFFTASTISLWRLKSE